MLIFGVIRIHIASGLNGTEGVVIPSALNQHASLQEMPLGCVLGGGNGIQHDLRFGKALLVQKRTDTGVVSASAVSGVISASLFGPIKKFVKNLTDFKRLFNLKFNSPTFSFEK